MLYPESFLGCGFDVRVLISPDYLVFEMPLTHSEASLKHCLLISMEMHVWRANREAGVCLALSGEPSSVLGTRAQGLRCWGSGGWERRPQGCAQAHRPLFLWDFRGPRAAAPPRRPTSPPSQSAGHSCTDGFCFHRSYTVCVYLLILAHGAPGDRLTSDPQLSEERVTIVCLLDISFVHDF